MPTALRRTIPATTVGAYLVSAPEDSRHAPLLVGFHGYGQNAEICLADLQRIPGSSAYVLVAIQALHRFYDRKQNDVVGSWMTSADREQAIADNERYVASVVAAIAGDGAEMAGSSTWASPRERPWPIARPLVVLRRRWASSPSAGTCLRTWATTGRLRSLGSSSAAEPATPGTRRRSSLWTWRRCAAAGPRSRSCVSKAATSGPMRSGGGRGLPPTGGAAGLSPRRLGGYGAGGVGDAGGESDADKASPIARSLAWIARALRGPIRMSCFWAGASLSSA